MALPTTIVSASQIAGHTPPFKSSGGNFYAVGIDATGTHRVFKATDPTDSWTVQDTGASSSDPATTMSAVQSGDILHMVWWEPAASRYVYVSFDMSDDTYNVLEAIEVPDNAPTVPWISVAVESTGVVKVVYSGDTDQVMGGKKERVDVNIRNGGTWDGPTALDAAGDIHYGNPNCVKASGTDNIHVNFQQTTNTADPPALWLRNYMRTIDPSDVLSTIVSTAEDSGARLLGLQNGISWDDAGTEKIRFCMGQAFSEGFGKLIRLKEDGSNDLVVDAAFTEYADSSHSIKLNNDVSVTTLAIDTADDSLHVLWSNADDTDDLWYSTSTDKGATWSTEAEELDGVSINQVSANIYVRGADTVLAYVYQNITSTLYNEKILTVGLNATLTGTAVPTQTEDDIVTGGKTIIITLIGDTFVTGTTSEDAIAGGSDSDKTGANKWDSLIKTALDNTDVVLSVGDTVATITLPAFATYNTAETETITWTIPAASLTTSGSPLVATPTHTVTAVGAGHPINYHRMMR
jgi:hypothetical protein